MYLDSHFSEQLMHLEGLLENGHSGEKKTPPIG
jgi:hypothetical protein